MDGRSYSQRVVIVEPHRGVPLRRLLFVLVAAVLVTANLPVPVASADSFSGNSSAGCVTGPTVLTSFVSQGWAGASIQFHLTVGAGGTVGGRWEDSNGFLGGQDHWSAGTSGSGAWWVGATGYRNIQFSGGGGHSMRYVVFKVAPYGGCYTVDSVVVTRYPVLSSTPVPGNPSSAPPQQSTPPEPTPPPGYDCNGSSDVDDCDPPPDGWCWAEFGAAYGSVGHELVECEAPASAPPAPPGSLSGAPSSCQNIPLVATYRMTGPWSHSAGGAADLKYMLDGGGFSASQTPTNGMVNLTAQYPTACMYVHFTSAGGSGVHWASGTGQVSPGVFASGWEEVSGTGNRSPRVGSYNSSLVVDYIDIYGTTGQIAGGGSPPDPDPSFDPGDIPPPSGWPSAAPPDPDGNGGPVDQCEGPDDAALFMCGDGDITVVMPSLNVNVELCPSPMPDIAACQPQPSFEAGGEQGDGTSEDGGLGSQLGSGVAECEGANLTPVESKTGYIAPEPVPSVIPLEARLAGFDIFSLDRAPAYVVGAIGWVGDMVGVIPGSVRNTATGVYNGAVHLVVPGDCLGTMVETKLTAVMDEPPFSIWTEAREAIEAGAAGAGGIDYPAIPLMDGGEVELPLGDLATATAPIRPAMEAGIWLFVFLGVIRIVVGSFHVGRGAGE